MNDLLVLIGIESWKPVLSALLLPPVPFIVLMLIGTRLVLPRRGLGWLVVLTGAVLLWLSSCTGTARFLTQFALRPPGALSAEAVGELKARVQRKEPVAIVVLGGGARPLSPEYGISNLNNFSLERLRYGVWLAKETGAPLAFSGGVGWAARGDSLPEAQIAARIADREFGRPLKWTEERSRDTRENASYTVALLKPQGIREFVVVTQQVHMPRALRAFEQAAQGGVRIVAAPVDVMPARDDPRPWLPSMHGVIQVQQALHELIGIAAGA